MKALLILASLFTSCAFADNMILTLASKHINSEHEFSEVNPGIGYLYELQPRDQWPAYVTGGIYRNSFKRTSVYLTAGYRLTKRLGFEVGGVTGYKSKVSIGAVGVIDLNVIRLIITPPLRGSPAIIGLQAKF